jgi:pimeloyl-ACP methyl ester carboxylesterase
VIDDGDVHLVAHVHGDGPLIVCHPGYGRWGRDFEPVVDALTSAGHRVALLDPRGVGESAGPLDGLTMHDLALDVLRVAHHLGTPPFDLVGHAFGNRVVRCAAADALFDVGRVALLAAGGSVAGPPEAYAALRIAMDMNNPAGDRLRALQEALFAPGNDATSWLDGWHAAAIAAQGSALQATADADWIDGGSAGVLVVQGLDDVLAPAVNGRQLVQRLGGRARLVELAGAGHALLPEQPGAISAALIEFFAQP